MINVQFSVRSVELREHESPLDGGGEGAVTGQHCISPGSV